MHVTKERDTGRLFRGGRSRWRARAGAAVALDHGPDRRPVWFSGGKLAADLSLPKLRRRWAGPRLTGRGMGDPPARTVLAREALRAARAARSEPEFFALLERAGLLARLLAAPDQAGRMVRHPARPGGPGRAARVVRGRHAGPGPAARRAARPLAGRAARPTGHGPGLFTGAARAEVYEHVARAAGPTSPRRRPTC